jgi:hypothetical protein
MKALYMPLVLILIFTLSCSSSHQQNIAHNIKIVTQQLQQLSNSLARNKLANAQLLKIYSSLLTGGSISQLGMSQASIDILTDTNLSTSSKKLLLQYQTPQPPVQLAGIKFTKLAQLLPLSSAHTQLVDKLRLEASPQAEALANLYTRLDIVKNNPASIGREQEILDEIVALAIASNPTTYNSSLVDIINVLADISQRALPYVKQQLKAGDKSNQQPGSHLVGNSNYGQWQSSGGNSIWVWYLQYRLFSSLFMRPYYYHSWYYNRPYSYYNDYGRSAYGSKREIKSAQKVTKKNSSRTKRYGAANNLRRSAPSMQQRRASSYMRSSQRLGTRSRSRFGGK